MDKCFIKHYSFFNCIHKTGVYNNKDIDYSFIVEATRDYNKIITLGNFASNALKKLKIEHFAAPHPSGLNRLFNKPGFDNSVVYKLREYIYE